ncbi:MAG TPA: hypothetical protein VF021_06995 [Longimicrobiales bacterium]
MRAVALITGILLATAGAQAQTTRNAPVCKAEPRGGDIVTRIQYPDGYVVEGPWRLMSRSDQKSATTVVAVLDRIVEMQPLSQKRQTTALPNAVEMTFSGTSFDDVLVEAAHVWCMTVIQARPPLQADGAKAEMLLGQHRIM